MNEIHRFDYKNEPMRGFVSAEWHAERYLLAMDRPDDYANPLLGQRLNREGPEPA